MSDGGLTTVQSGNLTVTTNSGISQEDLAASLKGPDDKAASEAASRLGKRGGKASAEARSERAAEPEEKPEATERAIKPIPAKVAAKAEPEPEPEPEPKAEEKSEGEEKPEEQKDRRGDPRHDPKARMLEATRQAAEAKRALAEKDRAIEALESRLAKLEEIAARVGGGEREQPKHEQKREGNGRPNPQDFDTYEEYLDARDEYNDRRRDEANRHRDEAQSFDHALEQARQRFAGNLQKAGITVEQLPPELGELRPEFSLRPGETATGENWLANELFFSPDTAPSLMLHLMEHPDELQRIAALSNPRAVSREMAKLEARLEAATTGPSSKREAAVSTAAPPVKPVTGKSYVSDGEWRPGMSLDEYHKIWKKQTSQR